MIAARIARHQAAEPTEHRDIIGWLLFYRMDWCEQHPKTMLTCIGALAVLAGVIEKGMV